MKQGKGTTTESRAAHGWAECGLERLLELATLPIAILYWQLCQLDERSSQASRPAAMREVEPCHCNASRR